MNYKRNVFFITIVIITLITLVVFATYAYFASNATVSNVANLNAVSESNNMLFDTIGGAMVLNVTAANMTQAVSGNIAAENNTTLTVNFQANTDYSMVCSYDIVYEWTSNEKYQAHTSGVSEWEFTIKAVLTPNEHVYEGNNQIKVEKDLANIVGNQVSATVVSGATIDATGANASTAVWNISSKFYNVPQNQSSLAGKTYEGRFKVTNVSCVAGEAEKLAYWYESGNQKYAFPNNGGTLQTTGTSTGKRIYIGQDKYQHYVCATILGKEICFSQPYTQYGLNDHTLNEFTTESQIASLRYALVQAYADAGIATNDSNFYTNNIGAGCEIDNIDCMINRNGDIFCDDYLNDTGCAVSVGNEASCY